MKFKKVYGICAAGLILSVTGTGLAAPSFCAYADETGAVSSVIEEQNEETFEKKENGDAQKAETVESGAEVDRDAQDPEILDQTKKDETVKTQKSSGGVSAPNSSDVTNAKTFTGFLKKNNSWIYYRNGKEVTTGSDIVHGTVNGVNGWYYIKKGKADLSYDGFAENINGWWYVEKGKVTFKKNDVIQGTVKGENAWWNVKNSQVIFNETIEHNINGWWYIKDGKVDFNKTSVEHNYNGWWYVKKGKVDFSYNGFAKNDNGWWYIENGKVTFNRNDIIQGKVNGENAWWNVKGSKVVFNETVEQNTNGWWYIKKGKIDFSYNGFAENINGWWYIENGKVTFNRNDVIQGTVNGKNAWWNVKGSKVVFNETIEQNINGWWYIKDGRVDFTKTGVEHNHSGWWYVKNGKVDFSYNGAASNKNGKWFIVNGKVDFSANGWKTVDKNSYYCENGRVLKTDSFVDLKADELNGKMIRIILSSAQNYSIGVANNSVYPNADITVFNDNGNLKNNGSFRFEKNSEGTFRIVALNSELALGVVNGKVVQTYNDNSDNVKWTITKNSDGTFSFLNKASKRYLNAGTAGNGAKLTITEKSGSAGQKFVLGKTSYVQTVANGCYKIYTGGGGYAFDVEGFNPANGTSLLSYPSNGSAAQLFKIEYSGDGLYTLKTGASVYSSAVTVTGSKYASGVALTQNTLNNSSSQKWRIITNGNDYLFLSAGGRYCINVSGNKYAGGALKLADYTKPTASNTFTVSRSDGWLVRNGRKYYFNKNGDKPMIGLDVSAWSETVDWEKVKADGIEFAIIRTAHRGGRIDPYGQRNMNECERLGIPYGVYYYSTAVSNTEADNDVRVLLETVKGHDPQLGLYIDIEATDEYEAAFGSIYTDSSRRKITDLTKRIVNKIKAAGYTAGVYANEHYMKNVLYMSEMPEIKWVAKYYTNKSSDTNIIDIAGKGYKIWQFTDSGTVNGVPNKGYSDLNTLIEKYW